MFGALALSPIALRIASIALFVGAILFGGWYIHHTGYKSGYSVAETKITAEYNQYKEAQRVLLAKATAEAAKTESELQSKLLQSVAEKELEIKAINDRHQLIADSLRNRPSRPRRDPASSSSPAPATPQCPGAVGDGTRLYREDGEFLIGEAAAADTLRKALKQCREAYERAVEGTYKKP